MQFYDMIMESKSYLENNTSYRPEIGMILGSGLGDIADLLQDKEVINYADIPHFPQGNVAGHKGNFLFGKLKEKQVCIMQGRFHYFEGLSMKEITYPIYVMKQLGIKNLIITNACGCINTNFKVGDLMLIEDFLSLVSINPLTGKNDERLGPRFPDMSEPFSFSLMDLAKNCAFTNDIPFREGVYAFFQGPYYETRAEIRAIRTLGADVVGMSTVPETIVANYLGIKVLGISCLTNMATGLRIGNHSHEEVLEIANQSSGKLSKWLLSILENM